MRLKFSHFDTFILLTFRRFFFDRFGYAYSVQGDPFLVIHLLTMCVIVKKNLSALFSSVKHSVYGQSKSSEFDQLHWRFTIEMRMALNSLTQWILNTGCSLNSQFYIEFEKQIIEKRYVFVIKIFKCEEYVQLGTATAYERNTWIQAMR